MRAADMQRMYNTLPRKRMTAAKRLTVLATVARRFVATTYRFLSTVAGLWPSAVNVPIRPKATVTSKRAKCRSRRRARQPDECEIHHFA